MPNINEGFIEPNGDEELKPRMEKIDILKQKFANIAKELLRRKNDRKTILFRPDSDVVFAKISQNFNSLDDDCKSIANDFLMEMDQFSKNIRGVNDSSEDMYRLAHLFKNLGKDLNDLVAKGPNVSKIIELITTVEQRLKRKANQLDAYENIR